MQVTVWWWPALASLGQHLGYLNLFQRHICLTHSIYYLLSTHCSRSLSCASLTSAAAGRSYLAGYVQVRVTMWPDLSNTNKMTNKMTVTVTSFSRFLIKYILTYGLDWYQYGSTRYACSTPELRHLNHEIYIDCVKPNKQYSLCTMSKICNLRQ